MFRTIYPTLLLMMTLSLVGQDLNTVWGSYMSTNSNIAELEARQDSYLREQVAIKSNVDQLQKESTWYNAWINKYFLSNLSQRQLVILDSLEVIHANLEQLRRLEQQEMMALTSAYEQVLENYNSEEELPVDQRAASLQIGRWMTRSQPNLILFPDYTDVLEIEWSDPRQRQLLLVDVQHLLEQKIRELDSLRTLREDQAELAERLADFHEDLGLQMESDQDAQQRNSRGETDALQAWYTAEASNEFADMGEKTDLTAGRGFESSDPVSINVPREDSKGLSLEERTGNDLGYLKQKLQEYQAQLLKINAELNASK